MRRLLITSFVALVYVAALGAESVAKKKDQIYKSGVDGVTAAKPIRMPHLEPPKLPASKSGKESKERTEVVSLWGYVETDGKFHHAKVVKSTNHELDSYALKTVAQWEFVPCKQNGVPITCALALEITFHPH